MDYTVRKIYKSCAKKSAVLLRTIWSPFPKRSEEEISRKYSQKNRDPGLFASPSRRNRGTRLSNAGGMCPE